MLDAAQYPNLSPAQRCLIRLLADFLHGRPSAAPEEAVDWAELQRLAKDHSVSGIVYQQLGAFLPPEQQGPLAEAYASELYFYQNRVDVFRKLAQALDSAGIDFFTVKGLDLAQLYPVPSLRTMGDCDVVVHTKDKQRAHQLMLDLGMRCTMYDANEWMYFLGDLQFELHDHLLYDEAGNYRSSRDFADSAWKHVTPLGAHRFALDWSFHYVFLVLHLKKHLIHAGVGFRQFMDLWLTARRKPLDLDWINETLDAMQLRRFHEICCALLADWFSDEPAQASPSELALREEQTRKILGNGVFGFQDETNRGHRAANVLLQRKGGSRLLARLRRLRRGVFPPYPHMRYTAAYRFVDGRPWLLPAAWVYRFYRAVRYKLGKNGKQILDESFLPGEAVDRRARELAKWGL